MRNILVRLWRWSVGRWDDPFRSRGNFAEHLTVGVSLVIAVIAYFQYRVYSQQKAIMESSGKQTQQLIEAANINAKAARQIAAASDRNATAAESFATTAGKINEGLGGAVGKLNLQAEGLKQSVEQATRLAAATEKANANVIDSDRPWIGVGMTFDELVVGKIPTFTVTLVNSGKRPARVISQRTQGHYFENLPPNPPFENVGPASTFVSIPGFPETTTYNLFTGPISQETADLLAGGVTTVFEYIDVEYLDLGTGKSHFTHACWKYMLETNGHRKGFYSCDAYQDAT